MADDAAMAGGFVDGYDDDEGVGRGSDDGGAEGGGGGGGGGGGDDDDAMGGGEGEDARGAGEGAGEEAPEFAPLAPGGGGVLSEVCGGLVVGGWVGEGYARGAAADARARRPRSRTSGGCACRQTGTRRCGTTGRRSWRPSWR